MSDTQWRVTFEVFRQKSGQPVHYDDFPMDVNPDEYVLDVIERIWAFNDRSLTFRHACHHSTCGACGMRVNGVEKLTCITLLREVTRDGGKVRIEPLRNFPVLSDLVVDMSDFYLRLDETNFSQVAPLEDACLPFEKKQQVRPDGSFERLVDCLECGMCISACPIALTTPEYLGPGVLAAAQHAYLQTADPGLLSLVDSQDGVWRCHSAYECTAVCPSNVDPGWRIMDMRKNVLRYRIQKFFTR
ncbi:succinate dehydrogenase subunit B [Longilinea arvoryzae]|uniref:Fumarate reductase iron-sulfur subunit n=1 Tax=Longilinea arvoryzae TaxID=360412 RepID=A0A0S7BHK8_9CHLR|nr:2Fe-2S iron-sulfur cluster-binding protein [Longilinea arvoryzae]GAP14656.1 succinate dehydrogenase subunit B [Longilinea arvoryzae]